MSRRVVTSLLLERYCTPAKDSIAQLARLHILAANSTMINGEQCYPMAREILGEMIATAQRENDASFFRRYAQAIEMAESGKIRHQSLPALIVGAWIDFVEEHRLTPSRQEVKTRLGLTRGGTLGWKFEPRHVRRAFQAVSGLFDSGE